eukprot:g6552.t1
MQKDSGDNLHYTLTASISCQSLTASVSYWKVRKLKETNHRILQVFCHLTTAEATDWDRVPPQANDFRDKTANGGIPDHRFQVFCMSSDLLLLSSYQSLDRLLDESSTEQLLKNPRSRASFAYSLALMYVRAGQSRS